VSSRWTPCAGLEPETDGVSPVSVPSTRPISICSAPLWPASTPSKGFRYTHIVRCLYQRPALDQDEAHRRCERVSRLIVKLRGHGLVAKIPRARRYRVTPYGYHVMTPAIILHDDQFADHYQAT